MSGIDACLKIAKLTAAAGEMAPFPFIKGAAQCVVVILETIESAVKNRKDLQELAESIVTTLVVVRDTVIDHGPTSALCFKDFCLDFQTFLSDLLSKLNNESKSRGIRRLLKAKKISEEISAYRQRVQAAKEDFLIHTTTMTQLTLSDVHNDVTMGFSTLTGSMASERNVISTIKDNIEEIRTLGAQQSEEIKDISTRLHGSQQRSLYKGSVLDIIPGDIQIIKAVTHSSRNFCTVTYKDSYCTIENSNSQKMIREYIAQGNSREGAMEKLDQALDFLMKQRHPNLLQIFGVCRSPDFPAIIFHDTTLIPYHQYYNKFHDLPVIQVIQFFSELFQDLQSISDVLPMENYRPSGSIKIYSIFLTDIEAQVCVNKHGKLVFGDLLQYGRYHLGPLLMFYKQQNGTGKYQVWYNAYQSGDPLHTGQGIPNFNCYEFQPLQYKLKGQSDPAYCSSDPKDFYAPGSVLYNLESEDPSSLHQVLVGRTQPPLHWWDWEIVWHIESSQEQVTNFSSSFDNGPVSIKFSWNNIIRNSTIYICMPWKDSKAIVKSWIAQCDDLQLYIIMNVRFYIEIILMDFEDNDKFCHICNTKDQYHDALSLTITAPVIDYDTNTFKSWPVVSCSQVCSMDPLEERDILSVRVRYSETKTQWRFEESDHMAHLTIPELNTKHGFDPVCHGADVCKHFGWPLFEYLDPSTGEWTPNDTVSQESSGLSSVISDNIDEILNAEHDPTPCSTMDMAVESIAEAGGVPVIETRMVPANVHWQYDISIWALVVIFIAISIQVLLLSPFKDYLYL
ncbi:hypothetical protein IW261DRAFT_1506717 [Armillaria novae-zelandiae]|uniref:Protein kinase domain-containing protein n=1 Tax=Armillaria novae-zelandiae TaxID=153914 RepID=A0AA39NVY1_9AGAR|nr:hypothetical protein IW261DRAFT_1506717 [Armillaria novae-zelandiae]